MSTQPLTRPLSGRRCLVTGATGFLGAYVVRRLAEAGVRVTAQTRSGSALFEGLAIDTIQGDMTEPGWSHQVRNEWRWDDVVHLAGGVSKVASAGFAGESQVARAHVNLALAMSQAIPDKFSGRVVHASSMTVYGAAGSLPVKETQPLAPSFMYAFGKALAEDVWRSSSHADLWLLRFSGLFSATRKSGALFHFVRAGLAHQPIRVAAREPTLWDVLHVEDAADAVVRALASGVRFRGAMNVSYGEVVQLEQVARRIAALTGGSEVVNEGGIEHPPFQLEISLARERLGWPPTSLDDRLRALVSELGALRD